jgi:2-polyprenyl-3-methyl-5-hydroxy-6-metoxy-1,4-benzoquinol methylase
MLDTASRVQKAAKMIAVVEHFLGRDDLADRRVLDVGCSGGIVASEFAARGARVFGVDIDVPGVSKAAANYGDRVDFVLADSEQLPFADGSFDIITCNHVYEHVVDPFRLFAEMRRVLRGDGLLYLGLANRLGLIEPHYRLPMLSWLPPAAADRYVRATGRATHYHERLTTRGGLRELCRGLTVWDYTFTVLAEPSRFAAADVVRGPLARVPSRALKALQSLIPTYLWVATPAPSQPAGPPTSVWPTLVPTPVADERSLESSVRSEQPT